MVRARGREHVGRQTSISMYRFKSDGVFRIRVVLNKYIFYVRNNYQRKPDHFDRRGGVCVCVCFRFISVIILLYSE